MRQRREPSRRAVPAAALTEHITAIRKASKQTHGVPRVHAKLADEAVRVGRKRLERLMKAEGLPGASRRRSTQTTALGHRDRPACELVDRNFRAEKPDQLRIEDPTFVPTSAGFLHLAVVLNAFSRPTVGSLSAIAGDRLPGSGCARASSPRSKVSCSTGASSQSRPKHGGLLRPRPALPRARLSLADRLRMEGPRRARDL